MPVFYSRISAAEVCYIFEAAEWLALGELPTFYSNDNGTEARLTPISHADHFEPVSEPNVFLSEAQASILLPKMSFSKYEDALELTEGKTVDQILAQAQMREESYVEIIRATEDVGFQEALRKSKAETAECVDLAHWLEQEIKPFQHHIDQARATLFLALSKGDIQANGYKLCLDEKEDYQFCEVVEIPKEAWLWSDVNWDLASTVVDGVDVIGAYVDTSELLQLFPNPNLQANHISGLQFGDTMILDEASEPAKSSFAPQRGRGRPQKGEGVTKTAVINQYRKELVAGKLTQKKEANLQHMIDWANAILGQSVGRTTMQRWIVEANSNAQKEPAQKSQGIASSKDI